MKRKNKSWYKPKGYLHFSHRLNHADKHKVREYIENEIAAHNFFPLLHTTLSTRKYKAFLDEKGNLKKSHFNTVKKKPTKKDREVFYANHLDAHIYSFFSNELLGVQYEETLKGNPTLSECVIAYRRIPIEPDSKKNKCNIHFAKEVFDYISKKETCTAVCYDIENFFPSLDHEYLKTCWANLLSVQRLPQAHFNVYRSLVNYSYVELDDVINATDDSQIDLLHRKDFNKSDFTSYFINAQDFRDKIAKKNLIKVNKPDANGVLKGIPQGTPISAFLANLYLLEFDKFIVDNIVLQEGGFYRRYSDDIVIVFNSDEQFVKWDEQIRSHISQPPFNLVIQKDKTVVTKFQRLDNQLHSSTKTNTSNNFIDGYPLRYLGFDFNGKNILVKSASLAQFYSQAKSAIRNAANRANYAQRYNKKHPRKKAKNDRMYLTKLYGRYTHLGKNTATSNYLSYIDRAAAVMYEEQSNHLNPIKKQVRRSWSIFTKTVDRYRTKQKGQRHKKSRHTSSQ